MQVIAFTGLPGAGKSEAVEAARGLGIPIVVMGDFVRREAKAEGLAPTDDNLGRLATRRRQEQGADYWAQRTADAVLKDHGRARRIVIDGVRTLAEVEAFRRRLGERFRLVAIDAPPTLRSHRLLARGRSDDAKTQDALRKRDEREKGWGIEAAIAAADHRILNDPTLAEFRRRVTQLLEQIAPTA